jgi:putative membrane protein
VSREVWDPGLQSERTRLAWVRTAVVLSGAGLGAGGVALRHDLPPATAVVFAVATLCGGFLLARTGVRFRRVQEALHGGRPVDAGLDALVAWVGALCVVAGAAALTLALAVA